MEGGVVRSAAPREFRKRLGFLSEGFTDTQKVNHVAIFVTVTKSDVIFIEMRQRTTFLETRDFYAIPFELE